jgi:hypothetical protein
MHRGRLSALRSLRTLSREFLNRESFSILCCKISGEMSENWARDTLAQLVSMVNSGRFTWLRLLLQP